MRIPRLIDKAKNEKKGKKNINNNSNNNNERNGKDHQNKNSLQTREWQSQKTSSAVKISPTLYQKVPLAKEKKEELRVYAI